MKGSIYSLRRPPDARGHEQAGKRFAVVVLASRYAHLSQWLVVPTSTRAAPAPYRPQIVVAGQPTLVLCDALVSVDPTQRLGDPVDYLSLPAMRDIDESLALLLDLDVV